MSQLIETDFPFAELSLLAERESWRKEIYRPVYYLHKWWARRLGSVFRGILLGACLKDKDDFWDHFYSRNDFSDTTLFDPFMGSGVTIGEALKLGCKVIGRDINPVAWLSCNAAFSEYGYSDVVSVYKDLETHLAPRMLQYYQTTDAKGDDATVLYFFLVKVVPCPDCGHEIELFKSRIFSRNATPRKIPSARSICPDCGAVNLTVYDAHQVTCPECSLSYDPQAGNIKGPMVTCDRCGVNFRLVDRMKSLSGPLKFRRYAKLLMTSEGEKAYEPLNATDHKIERMVSRDLMSVLNSFPSVRIKPGYNTDQMLKHNYRYWHEVFSDRQLLCAKYMTDAIKKIEQDGPRRLFASFFSGVLEFNNLFTSFKGEGTGAVRHMFAHHVLKPEVMPLEANMWGTNKSSGAFSRLFHSRVERALAYKEDPFELKLNGSKSRKIGKINKKLNTDIANRFSDFMANPSKAYLSVGDSSSTDLGDKSVDLVVTDPPFFDNVHYSELADFFYYWINQALELSSDTTTRSPDEVQNTDPVVFTNKLTGVFSECRRVLRPGGLFVFTYHHSRHEGWTAVHRAIRHSGFACVQCYPIKAEMNVSIPLQQAKSPIHLDLILVCREDSPKKPGHRRTPDTSAAIDVAKRQVSALKGTGIRISIGDAKVILMGRLLCEAHRLKNLEAEETFLGDVEENIDSIASQVLAAHGEVMYDHPAPKPAQLMLFEEIEKSLIDKPVARNA